MLIYYLHVLNVKCLIYDILYDKKALDNLVTSPKEGRPEPEVISLPIVVQE